MSSQMLSATQMEQLLAMLQEHGSEAVFFGLGEIAKQDRLKNTNTISKKVSSKKATKASKKAAKKSSQQARAEELAVKIKTTHDIEVDPSKFTLKALTTMLRTGEMQEQKKPKGLSPYMRFLQHERAENKKTGTPIASKELTRIAGQKWRDMTPDEKAAWKTAPAEDNVAPAEDNVAPAEDNVAPAEDNVAPAETPEKATKKKAKATKKKAKAPKMKAKAPKMKKKELKIHLSETYGWDIKKLSKFTVGELRIANETGEYPTKQEKATPEEKATPDEEATGISLFDMSDSDDDDDDEDDE